MPAGTQFTASLDPGQYQVWFTWGWGREFRVQWSVRPSSGQVGNVVLRALTVEAANDGTLTYHLTVWNIGSTPVTFDALYEYDGVDAFGSEGLGGVPNPVGLWGTTVLPQTFADGGDGVLGEGQNGVHGRSRSPSDSGVWGENTRGGYGVSGSTNSPFQPGAGGTAGVWGHNFGQGMGVKGTSAAGDAVVGVSTSNAHAGVSATNDSGGFGVWARGTPGGHFESSGGDGVVGLCSSDAHAGVSAANTGSGYGVKGSTNSSFQPGAGGTAGVWGQNLGQGIGVKGTSAGGDAVVGVSTSNAHAGVSATNDSGGFGVWARGTPGGHFESSGGDGVVGLCSSNAHAGVSATNTGSGAGVDGSSAAGYGGDFSGGHAPLRLNPANTPGHPTTGNHQRGELFVDSTGSLFYCKADGVPGTWVTLA